jgi:predicted TIM-barrel fold metal-dependent hydrolase
VLNRELQRLWYLGLERVGDAIFRLGEDMPIYGLDFPYNSVELVRAEIRELRGLDLSEEGFAKLFGGNLERALAPRPRQTESRAPGH